MKYTFQIEISKYWIYISGVIVGLLTSSVVDSWFEPWPGQTKDYNIGICCFSTNDTVLRRKSDDWWAQNQG